MASSHDYVDDLEKYNYKILEGFDGNYLITYCGRVISLHRGKPKFINGKLDKDGYRQIILRHNGVNLYKRVHRLVAEAFLHKPEDWQELVVCHLDGDVTNNHKDNLLFTTQKENISHKEKHGTKRLGEDVHNNTISVSTAREIKRLLDGGFNAKYIEGKLGVKKHTIYNIKYGNCWKWLTKANLGE